MADTPQPPSQPPAQNPAPPPFSGAEHQNKPRLRKVRTFPMPVKDQNGEQQQILGLADAQQISNKMVGTHPAMTNVLPLLDGSRDLDQIIAEIGRGLTREVMESFVVQLDEAALIFGPKFDALFDEMKVQFDQADTLPPGSTAQFADALAASELGQEATEEEKASRGPEMIPGIFDQWIDKALEKAENPAFDTLPAAIVVPGGEYSRSWLNYASAWGRLRVADRPDRVIILGANHFGTSTGVCGCDKGFESPMGLCPLDADFLELVKSKLGDENAQKLMEHRFDHEREHSIELQIPWVQHILGQDDDGAYVPVAAFLVHDPVANSGQSYDGSGLDLEPFVDAVREAIAEAPGNTLVVASADLSHVGKMFGDQVPLAEDSEAGAQARQQVAQTDQDLLKHLVEGRPDDLVSALAWTQNASRWASTGALVAASKITGQAKAQPLNYAASMDQQGGAMQTSVAMALFQD